MTTKMITIQIAPLSHGDVFANGDGTQHLTALVGRKKSRSFRTALTIRADLFQANRGVGVAMVSGYKGEETSSIAPRDRTGHKSGAPGALRGRMRTK